MLEAYLRLLPWRTDCLKRALDVLLICVMEGGNHAAPRCALTLFAIGSLSAHVPLELSKSACQALLMFYWHGTERVAPENDDSLGRLP